MTSPNKSSVSKRLSFGQYEGKLWSEIPTEYLQWFSNNAYHQMKNRRAKAIEELKRRGL